MRINYKKTILVDGMFFMYDEQFTVDKFLLDLLHSFKAKKILVVNGFREKGKKALEGNGFEVFSLEEEKIKKDSVEYFKRLFLKYNLTSKEVIYLDHDEKNVETARKLGIVSFHYTNHDEVKIFIEQNL